ncbi:MAG TPA: hypothetical protein VGD71_08650 [Kribbella sp.]|jgi:hypothetical protein
MTTLADVIPLRSKQERVVPTVSEPPLPEPTQLYGLTVLAFLLHVDHDGICPQCRAPWPCDHLRLAYRLREGF